MEQAVLERPEMEIPEFDEAEHARQMGAAGVPEAGEEPEELGSSLEAALGLPVALDLWPGHVYIPPPIKQLKHFADVTNRLLSNERKTEDEMIAIIDEASEVIAGCVLRVKGTKTRPVTVDDVQEEFNPQELGNILVCIMQDQGIMTEQVQGNSPSGRPIGLKSFITSAASTTAISSPTAEN